MADGFHVFTNAEEIAAALGVRAERVRATMRASTQHAALLLETRIKAHASGRPGPNVITGDYRASWTTQQVGGGVDGASYRVGTDRPQARRLEFGFFGMDALGRHYEQRPYPHVQPALQGVREAFIEAVRRGLL